MHQVIHNLSWRGNSFNIYVSEFEVTKKKDQSTQYLTIQTNTVKIMFSCDACIIKANFFNNRLKYMLPNKVFVE